jgi:hypothetical protein
MKTQAEFQGRSLMAFRTGAIVVAIVSGFYALAALLVGSPLEFGVALASCGGCWVAADFIEWRLSASVRPADGLCRLCCLILPTDRRIRYVIRLGTSPCRRGHDYCERRGHARAPRYHSIADGGHPASALGASG